MSNAVVKGARSKSFWIALIVGIVGVTGCADPDSVPSVKLQSVELKEWTAGDGKIYLCALPTWKNDGSVAIKAVQSVALPTDGGADFQERDKIIYSGDALPSGSIFHPVRLPEDGIVLGEKASLSGRVKSPSDVKLELLGWTERVELPKHEAQ